MLRALRRGPAAGLAAQVLLLTTVAQTAGLARAGWIAGAACGLVADATLTRALLRDLSQRLGPAGWVTLARATLVVGVTALTADSLAGGAPTAALVALATAALVLDYVDGQVARRTGTESQLGARMDGEVDAFLILVLSVAVAPSAGAWVLAIGAARYAFLVAGWLFAWMRAPLPRREWRKVVAATQGIALTVAVAGVLPLPLTQAGLAAALALLAESFGRDVWWLWRRRHAAAAGEAPAAATVLTVLSVVVVWAALVAPDQPSGLTPGAFVRLPIEGIAVVAFALLLPARARRVMAWVVGPALGLLLVVKILDVGFFTAFDRPFNPVDDWSYASIGVETLRDSVGRTRANIAVAGLALVGIAALVLPTLAVVRLTRVAAGHRRRSVQAVAALGVAWVLCWAVGAQLVAGAPIASTSAVEPGGGRDAGRAGRHRGPGPLRIRPAARPLRLDAGRPPADRSARKGRRARLRRELRPVRRPGLVVLARGRLGSRRGHAEPACGGLLLAQWLAHLADLRRHQLARALDAAVGRVGEQPHAI